MNGAPHFQQPPKGPGPNDIDLRGHRQSFGASGASFSSHGGIPPRPRHFGDLIRMFSDPEKVKSFVRGHKNELRGYAGVILFTLLIFVFISDRTFSFFLTISSIISMCSFLLILIMVEQAKSVEGLSVRMLELWMLISVSRMFAIIPFVGYLPYDKSGDWFYQVSEALLFLLVSSVLYLSYVPYKHTYNEVSDAFQHKYLAIGCFVVAVFVHPSLNRFMPADICWAFALYLEALASLPQLYLFQREKKILPWTAHFLAAQGMARLCSLIFWLQSYTELHDHHVSNYWAMAHKHGIPYEDKHAFAMIPGHATLRSIMGYWILFVQAFQLLLMGDFAIQYVKCLGSGRPISMLMADII